MPRAGRVPRRLLATFGDERLIRLVRAGRPEAFEAIYDRHHAAILSFCRHMLGNREDGEDAALQVFAGAHREIVDSTKSIHLRPWLYAVARNRCLSMLRARREVTHLDAGAVDEPADTEGLHEIVGRREDLRHLVADMGTLPEQQRAALVLFELGDLSHTQIGEVLDCPAPRVKALVFQARTNLMNDRKAREVDCQTVREELSVLRGPSTGRGYLRGHLQVCPGCAQFARELKMQRASLALVLPVIPTAGLKSALLSSIFGSHGASTGMAGAGALTSAHTLVGKVTVGLVLVGVSAGAGVAAIHHGAHSRRQVARAVQLAGSSSVILTREDRALTVHGLPSLPRPVVVVLTREDRALTVHGLPSLPRPGARQRPHVLAGVHRPDGRHAGPARRAGVHTASARNRRAHHLRKAHRLTVVHRLPGSGTPAALPAPPAPQATAPPAAVPGHVKKGRLHRRPPAPGAHAPHAHVPSVPAPRPTPPPPPTPPTPHRHAPPIAPATPPGDPASRPSGAPSPRSHGDG